MQESIAGTCMDGIKSLRASLHANHYEFGDKELVMFKSDIWTAYQLM